MSGQCYEKLLIDCSDGVVLEIVCPSSSGAASPHPRQKTVLSNVTGWPAPSPPPGLPAPISISDSPDMLLAGIRLREFTNYSVAILFPAPRDRVLQARHEGPPGWPFLDPVLLRAWTAQPPENWPLSSSPPPGTTRVTGTLNFMDHVGLVNLSVTPAVRVEAEVVPAKMSYEEDFRQLLYALSDITTDLVLHVEGVSTVNLGLAAPSGQAYRTQILHLRRLMAPERLPSAVARILNTPHNLLHSELEMQPLALARDFDLMSVPQRIPECGFHRGSLLAGCFSGWTPERVPVRRKHVTLDTPENRFVRHALRQILDWLLDLAAALPEDYTTTRWAINSWLLEIEKWLHAPMFREIGGLTYVPLSSVVLQRREGYREFLKAFLSFALGLSISADPEISELAEGNLRRVNRLYEYWCFLKVAEILGHLSGIPDAAARALVQIDETDWQVQLAPRERSRIPFRLADPPLSVELWYNRDFTLGEFEEDSQWDGAYSGLFHPDISLRVTTDQGLVHWVHFDAKYRLDRQKWLALFRKTRQEIKENEKQGVFDRGDLYTMHAYRDAILGSRGSYIIYPGPVTADRPVFVRNPESAYRRAHSIPSVGAFPLVPVGFDGGAEQAQAVENFLRDLFVELAGASRYDEETGLA